MDPPTDDDDEFPSEHSDDDDGLQEEPELNPQRFMTNRQQQLYGGAAAAAAAAAAGGVPAEIRPAGVSGTNSSGGGGGGGGVDVSLVSSLTTGTTSDNLLFAAATDPRTIAAAAAAANDDDEDFEETAAAAADYAQQRVRHHHPHQQQPPAAAPNEAASSSPPPPQRQPQRYQTTTTASSSTNRVVLPRFKDQVGEARTLQLSEDAVFPVHMLHSNVAAPPPRNHQANPHSLSSSSAASTTSRNSGNDQRNITINSGNTSSNAAAAAAAAEEPCYSSSQYTGTTTTTTTTATTNTTNETSTSASYSDRGNETTAPYANVRVLTHSVLFAPPSTSTTSDSLSPEQQQPVAVATPLQPLPAAAAVFVPAIHDRSILTTGYAEDQFEPQHTRRPKFVTVTVFKPAVDTLMGTTFGRDEMSGCVYISGFRDKGNDLSRVLALSPLGVGDKLLTVNEIPCAGMDNRQVASLLRNLVGPVTIAIENVSGDPSLVETMVEKDAPDTTVGLNFAYTFLDGGYVRVTKVSGLFANSFVQVGDRVVLVNGERPYGASHAKDLVRSSPRFVSVTVESRTGVVLPLLEEEEAESATASNDNNKNNSRSSNSSNKKEGRRAKSAPPPPPEAANCDCCIL